MRSAAHYIPAARAGSREALGEMLQACRAYLLLIAQQELAPDLRAKAGASDLVQETFADACRDFIHFRGDTEAELLGWLRQVLRHNLANFIHRYRATAKRRAALEVPLAADGSSVDWTGGLIADVPTPSAMALAHEQAEAVRQALENLPADYRQVILWRVQEGLSFEAIGRLLGRTTNAAEKLWARAIRRVQQGLEVPP